MKIKVLTATLASMAIIFGISIAYAAPPSINLVGTWQMTIDKVNTDGYSTESGYFVIDSQEGDLFKGFGCPLDLVYAGRTELYGVLEGKNIYVTSNDALAFGTVNQVGTEIEAINQVMGYDELGNSGSGRNESAAERVVATKVFETAYDCLSIPSP